MLHKQYNPVIRHASETSQSCNESCFINITIL